MFNSSRRIVSVVELYLLVMISRKLKSLLCSPGQPVLIYRLSTKYSIYIVLDNCDLFHKARGIEWSGIEMLQDERCFFLCKLR